MWHHADMTKQQKRRVVGYARLSKGDDLQTQLEDIQQLALQRGLGELAPEDIYTDESISAAELHGRQAKGRPGFDRLMAAVRRDEISHILVRATDRLIRGRRQRVDVYEALARHSVSLLVLKGVDVRLDSASGRLVAGVLAEVAAHEVEIQSERTQRALRRRLEEGLPPTSGRVFGYTPDGMTLVDDEAAAVRGAFAALLAGGSLTGIARQLNATGLLTRGGKAHTAGTTRGMLRNLRYAAVREDADGKAWPLVSPRIVDEDAVRAARAVLADPARRSSASNASRWALSSIGDCGACGASKVTSGSRGKAKNTGEPVPIYRCPGCRKLGRSAQPVDDYLRALVAAVIERDADELMTPAAEDPAVAAARDAVTTGRQRLEDLAQLVADGVLDPQGYARAVGTVNERVRAAQGVLEGHYRDAVLVGVTDAADVRAAVDALPLDRFRRVLEVLFESVTLLPAAGFPKTLGFQPDSVAVVLRNGKARPVMPGETVTLTLTPATARDLAEALRSGGWPVTLRRGGRVLVPATAVPAARQVAEDADLYGLTYPLDPASAVRAAVRTFVDTAPELTEQQRDAVRAALAAP